MTEVAILTENGKDQNNDYQVTRINNYDFETTPRIAPQMTVGDHSVKILGDIHRLTAGLINRITQLIIAPQNYYTDK